MDFHLEICSKLKGARKSREKLVPIINTIVSKMGHNHPYLFTTFDDYSIMEIACQFFDVEAISLLWKNGWYISDDPLNIDYLTFKDILRVFCSLGVDLLREQFYNHTGYATGVFCKSPLVYILTVNVECGKICIENGYRLKHIKRGILIENCATYALLEQGVINCRNVIVILLGLRRKHKILPLLDRFLVQQVLAVEIWTTRGDDEWQRKASRLLKQLK